MCFGNTPEAPAPAAPAETLNQASPEKKTAATDTNRLSIGTKKYRTNSGISGANTTATAAPTGIALAK